MSTRNYPRFWVHFAEAELELKMYLAVMPSIQLSGLERYRITYVLAVAKYNGFGRQACREAIRVSIMSQTEPRQFVADMINYLGHDKIKHLHPYGYHALLGQSAAQRSAPETGTTGPSYQNGAVPSNGFHQSSDSLDSGERVTLPGSGLSSQKSMDDFTALHVDLDYAFKAAAQKSSSNPSSRHPPINSFDAGMLGSNDFNFNSTPNQSGGGGGSSTNLNTPVLKSYDAFFSNPKNTNMTARYALNASGGAAMNPTANVSVFTPTLPSQPPSEVRRVVMGNPMTASSNHHYEHPTRLTDADHTNTHPR